MLHSSTSPFRPLPSSPLSVHPYQGTISYGGKPLHLQDPPPVEKSLNIPRSWSLTHARHQLRPQSFPFRAVENCMLRIVNEGTTMGTAWRGYDTKPMQVPIVGPVARQHLRQLKRDRGPRRPLNPSADQWENPLPRPHSPSDSATTPASPP